MLFSRNPYDVHGDVSQNQGSIVFEEGPDRLEGLSHDTSDIVLDATDESTYRGVTMADIPDDLDGLVIDEETVTQLALIAGITIDADRRADVATMLRDMVAFADELAKLDLDGSKPAAIYDPTWPDLSKKGQTDV
jgi:hypothetical protein